MAEVHERVKRGAQLLDEHFSEGWAHRIDVPNLSMSDFTRCDRPIVRWSIQGGGR